MFWVLLLLLAWAAPAPPVRGCAWPPSAPPPSTRRTACHGRGLTLYEAAFLSGGPARVADLTLVSMARQRRLLLAHTGWATVVDPRGRDEMERSVIGRDRPVRTVADRAGPVRPRPPRSPYASSPTASSRRASPCRTAPARPSRAPSARCGPPRRPCCALGAVALLMPSQAQEIPGPGRPLVHAPLHPHPELPRHRPDRGPPLHALGVPCRASTCSAPWPAAPTRAATTVRTSPPWPYAASARSANRICGRPSRTASRTPRTRPGRRRRGRAHRGHCGRHRRAGALLRQVPTKYPFCCCRALKGTRCELPPSTERPGPWF